MIVLFQVTQIHLVLCDPEVTILNISCLCMKIEQLANLKFYKYMLKVLTCFLTDHYVLAFFTDEYDSDK